MKHHKRLTFKRGSKDPEVLYTPAFLTSFNVIQGNIQGKVVEILTLDGVRLFYQVAASQAEAKVIMKEQLMNLGVKFLDEARKQDL